MTETIFDDPFYTVDAIAQLEAALSRLYERYEFLKREPKVAPHLARDWDGLDLTSTVSILREAARTVDLLAGYDWEAGE